MIQSIFVDSDGYVWIGAGDEGLNRFISTTKQVIHYKNDPNRSNSISSNEVLSIDEDQEGMRSC